MTDVNPVRSDNCRQYNNVPPQIDLPAMDHEIIDLWARQHTFDKSLEATKDGQPWTFFEGPPTANGQPGTCLLYTSPSPRDQRGSRMPSSA